MNDILDVILVNRCNQSDEFRTVLPAKMCVRALLILMLAATVLAVGAGVGAAATTRYVDDGGGANYDTIQDAVDVAGAGDTIYVYDGTYNENVVITTSITLAGQSESGVTIDGGGSGDCVQVSSSDVTINGFTITNASKYGIRADYSDIAIENVTITANGGHGIYFVHGKGFTIRDSTIDGNAGGIIYGGNRATGDAVVEDNIITNNIGSGLRIDLTEGKSATVRNNIINNNAGGSSDGIYVYIAGTGGVMTIEDNPVTQSGGHGIYLTGVRTGSTIANFTVQGSGSDGLRADYSDLNIENVTITGNSGKGIYFVHGKGFTIRDSTIDGNAGGIIYGGNRATGDAVVEDNIITNNIGSGLRIDLTEGKSATVRNNIINNNAGGSSDGIYVYIAGTGGVMTIEDNPVTQSGGHGIYLTGVRTGSTIANFTVQGSGSDGLRADYSDLNIENVTITGNSGKGIYFVHGKGFTIRDSTIDGNAGGIIYGGNRATGDAVVEDNIITNNIGSGLRIDLTEGKSATVRNNIINNNAGGSSDGIYVYIAGTGGVMTIEDNPVTQSGGHGIYLTGVRTGSTIANFTVQGSGSDGLRADYSDLNIENVTITGNSGKGIYFVHGKGFTIRDSTIDGNAGGIIYGGNRATGDAVVEDNIITNNIGSGLRIDLTEGKSATVRNNIINNNAGGSSDGIYVYIAGTGGVMDIENNPVAKSGQRGIYLRGIRSGSTIANFTVQGSGSHGIRAEYSDLEIENVTVTGNGAKGIYFVHGKSFTIRNSKIDGNAGGIIYAGNRATGDAVVEDNIITNNIGSGLRIDLTEGKSATVRNNIINNNAGSYSDGIYVYIQGTGGVATIKNNLVEDSGRYGIYLTGVTKSVVAGNDIMWNGYGMYLHSSSNNSIFHNDFIDNANYNAKDDGTSNSWDDGYPSAGNYWSDHGGADNFRGPGQDQSGKDGIIDTPHPVQGGSGEDRYPLVNPWPLKGDLNGDHLLTPADAAIALRIAATGAHDDAADVSGDGCVTSLDALMILQAAADAINL